MHSIIETVVQNGISESLIYFLLVIPFIVMIATFVRHMIGAKIMEMHVIISVAFILSFLIRESSLISVLIGFVLLAFIYFFAYFVKRLTSALGLHYFARISVVISIVSFVLLTILVILGQFSNVVSTLKLSSIMPFGFILAILLGEYFSSNQTQKGIRKSRSLFINSLVVSLILGLLISWREFEILFLQYPFVVFVFILLSFIFGRYTGVRLFELIRFRDIKSDRE